jgi:hypothetical protein
MEALLNEEEKLFIPSSDPQEKRRNVRYGFSVITAVGLIFLSLCVLALRMDPLVGDLTRAGGYLENDYGWNLSQEGFHQPLFRLARNISEYDRPFDVVVFGDSFSIKETSGWQNFFVHQQSCSVITIVANDGFVLDDVLQSPVFRKSPPALLIYEVAERNLASRTREDVTPPGFRERTQKHGKMTVPTGISESSPHQYHRQLAGLDSFSLDAAADFVRKYTGRLVVGDRSTDVREFRLTRHDLFSSRQSERLLIFSADLVKASLSEPDRNDIARSLETIRDRVAGNGRSRFVLLIAPDKLTAYWDYIIHDVEKNPTLIPNLAARLSDVMPRADETLKAAIRTGVMDVYLPDDTHWGSAGHKLAADTVCRFLAQTEKGK